jgi:hypothetical protein|tara:strand:- start:29 stop:322 length:294 start_codon:yes stop_codon:yes gene_type:complete
MKENNKQTSCEPKGSLTQVSTTYARICVILLALNFGITGYVLTGVMKIQQETSQTQIPATRATPQARTAASAESAPSSAAESATVTRPEEFKTLEKE